MSRVTRILLMIMVGIGTASPALYAAQGNNTGAVFIMTNDAKKNQVIAYERAADGTLSEPVYYDTNGRGSGGTTDSLESQGSLTLSQDHSLLFAVNAGSGTVSVFSVHKANPSPKGGRQTNLLHRIEVDCT